MKNDSKKNIFSSIKSLESNWILTSQQVNVIKSKSKNVHRLNTLDSEILESKNALKVDDEPLNLNYRIEEKEKVIKDISKQISVAEKLYNQQELFTLRVKKQRLDKELQDLYKEYNSKDTMIKSYDTPVFTGNVSKNKMPVINAIKKFIKRHILARVSKRFKVLVALSDSLDKLNSINTNVDELLKMKTPYGETAQNYKILTEYLSNANKIRSQINKSIKKK